MNWFVVPALLSLTIKILTVAYARHTWSSSRPFFILLIFLAAHNVAELFLFVGYFNHTSPQVALDMYYVCTVLVLTMALDYAADASSLNRPTWLRPGMTVVAVGFIGLILFTESLIGGYEVIGYGITRVPGPQYWLFQAFALGWIALSVSVLVLGYRQSENHHVQLRCLYTLFAMLPPLLTAVVVVILMAFEVTINAMIALPIATTLFVLITLKSESKHRLTDIRRHLPFSLERRAALEITEVLSQYAQEGMSHTEAMDNIERELLTYKHQKSGMNTSKTARSMDIPRPTLYSKFRRHGIKPTDEPPKT